MAYGHMGQLGDNPEQYFDNQSKSKNITLRESIISILEKNSKIVERPSGYKDLLLDSTLFCQATAQILKEIENRYGRLRGLYDDRHTKEQFDPTTEKWAATVTITTCQVSQPTDQERYWSQFPETFEGVIIRHRPFSCIDEPAIDTPHGSYALLEKDFDFGRKNYGVIVKLKPVKEYYMTVEIVHS